MRSVAFALLFGAVVPSLATAQASRAVRALSLSADAIGVLVARDRVFVPDAGARVLSACSETRCAPVVRAEACTAPRCPGTGTLLALDHPIADVADLPTDRDGWTRAVDAMRSDPALASIVWSFGTHPEPPPPPPEPARWITPARRERVVWEAGAYALGGVLGATGVSIVGGEASVGFRFAWDPRGDDDELVAFLLGDVLGLDVRVRAFDLAQQ